MRVHVPGLTVELIQTDGVKLIPQSILFSCEPCLFLGPLNTQMVLVNRVVRGGPIVLVNVVLVTTSVTVPVRVAKSVETGSD